MKLNFNIRPKYIKSPEVNKLEKVKEKKRRIDSSKINMSTEKHFLPFGSLQTIPAFGLSN